ncbi:translation initiation factor IF-2 subunit gamma [Candidatus Woesearchaeota archaeon]|nr:translation initiation factor IF-2 subunit gamma [Candidatus Woesearchaeota archaeon]
MTSRKKSAGKEEYIQPVINIGMVGHVDHGKTTLLERLSGKWTDTHSEEIKRGITIRLGYADVVFRKCPKCGEFTTEDAHCEPTEFLRKVSFVDAPGHESLMATMLSGATIMDGALLLIAANEECPQPQTREHLMALEVIGVKNIIIVQNKVDLVSEERATKNYGQIRDFIKDTSFKDAPIIPLSAQYRLGVGPLIQAIEEFIPTPKRDLDKDAMFFVARSFDINKPGTKITSLVGGVLGGAIKQGRLRKGDDIEIRPGFEFEEKNQKVRKSIHTKIASIRTGGIDVEEAVAGGSLGILTTLDPFVVKSDKLTGSVVGHPGKLPPVWDSFDFEVHLLKRVVGLKEDLIVEPIKMNEPLMLNVNSAATVGMVTEVKKDRISCKLKIPVCAEKGSRVTISRRITNRFRLIGYGIIK